MEHPGRQVLLKVLPEVMHVVHDLGWPPPLPALAIRASGDPDYPPSTRSFG